MMTLDEAVNLLKNTVKYSAVPGQKHIDLSLVSAEELPKYEQALKVVQEALKKGETPREVLLSKLGLN